MPHVEKYCLTGKPVLWFEAAPYLLESPYLTDPRLVDRRFEYEFEQAVWENRERDCG